MKKIGTGRTAEVYDYKDDKVLKLFYSAFSDKIIEDEYLIAKNHFYYNLSCAQGI